MKIGLAFPTMPHDIFDVRAYARWASEHPGTTLWMGHSTLIDASGVASFLAGSGIRIPFGFGVALAPLIHPLHAASLARSVSLLTARPVRFGVGISSQEYVEAVRGAPYRRPGSRVAEYLEVMRSALGGEYFEYRGQEFSVAGSIHHASSPGVEVGAGVLRTGMARRVAPVADFVITWLCPPAYVTSQILPALDSSERGSADPVRLVATIQFSLDTREIDPVQAMAEINSAHLRSPHYRDMLRRAGVAAEPSNDVMMMAEQALATKAALHGAPNEIAVQLADLFAAGVDEIVLNPVSAYLAFGPRAALADVQRVLDELADIVGGLD